MSDVMTGLLQVNLVGSAAILLVLLARKPCRQVFGPRMAYALWLIVPLAMAASFAPAPPAGPSSLALSPAPFVAAAENAIAQAWTWGTDVSTAKATSLVDPAILLAGLWLTGALLAAAWLTMKQVMFGKLHAQGLAGPAVVGVFRPRVVTPADFEERFDARERALVIEHEATHLAHHDSRINALAALARCVCWFNPLVHVAAHRMQIDQELACDAGVIARYPRERAAYAEALLKSQLAAAPLPVGCYWPAGGEHPLTERIAMLDRPDPSRLRRAIGGMIVVVLAAGAGYAAWAATPVGDAPLALIERAPAMEAPAQDSRDIDELGRPRYGRPFAERFDAEALMNIEGIIVRVDWSKPNSALWVYGRATAETGADLGEKIWRIEGGNPFTISLEARATLEASVGLEVVVRGYGMKDKACEPNCWINGRRVTYANGEPLVLADTKASKPPCTLEEVLAYTCPGADKPSRAVAPPTAQEISQALAKAGKTAGRFGAPPIPAPWKPQAGSAESSR